MTRIVAAMLLLPLASTAQKTIDSLQSLGFAALAGRCDVEAGTHCKGRAARAWNSVEIRDLEASLREIGNQPTGAAVLRSIRERGASRIHRYDVGPQLSDPAEPAGTMNAAFFGDGGGVEFVELFDPFFEKRGMRDRRSGYSLQARMLLHEFFHALDDNGRKFSLKGVEFPRLLRMHNYGGGWLPDGITQAEKVAQSAFLHRKEVVERAAGYEEAWALDREWATSFRIPMPSARCWDNPKEAFAEIGAHLVLDKTARQYIPDAVARFFDVAVFSQLR